MNTKVKTINFDVFCHWCDHEGCESTEEPCNECLGTPTRENSHTPVNFKLKKRTKK